MNDRIDDYIKEYNVGYVIWHDNYSILNLLTIETVNIKLYEYIDQQFHDEQPLKVTFS